MTNLLSIETSTELASVSLLVHADSNSRLFSRELPGVQTHSHGLLPAIQALLQEAGIDIGQVTALAFGCGPGAFTGVRTACGVVQGLAFGLDLAVLPVVSLMAMAEAARTHVQWDEAVCLLDARMNEVYWAHYHLRDGQWQAVLEPSLSSLDEALRYADAAALSLVLGKGIAVPAQFAHLLHTFEMPHAQFAANLALADLARGRQIPAALAQPIYLRNKVAQTTAERLSAQLAKTV